MKRLFVVAISILLLSGICRAQWISPGPQKFILSKLKIEQATNESNRVISFSVSPSPISTSNYSVGICFLASEEDSSIILDKLFLEGGSMTLGFGDKNVKDWSGKIQSENRNYYQVSVQRIGPDKIKKNRIVINLKDLIAVNKYGMPTDYPKGYIQIALVRIRFLDKERKGISKGESTFQINSNVLIVPPINSKE